MYEEFIKYLKVYKPNEILIKEGEDGEDADFFCLLQGTVGIWKGQLEDKSKAVKIGEISERGTYFGEMSALLEEDRTATIRALDEPVKVLKFPGEMLSQMILKQPSLGLKVCTALADRLRGTTDQQHDTAVQRNEIRDDATSQFLHAKEAFQKVFVMLTTIQTQLQHPNLKACLEFMSTDKLLQGGRKIHMDEEFLADLPPQLVDSVKQVYSNILT